MSNRVAVIGGGPIGIEAAALLVDRDFDVTVYERGAPGAHVARWGHVRFFSPWRLNRSPWGDRILAETGASFDDEAFPTGADYLTEYLKPLVRHALSDRIRTMTDVRGITRRSAWKGDYIGDAARGDDPFLLSLSAPEGREWAEADIVLDATGTYQNPGAMGPGGLPALGEEMVEEFIEHWIPDATGRDREVYEGREILVVGGGHSASTTLRKLHELHGESPSTTVSWVFLDTDPPYVVLDDDPLPERRELSEFGNRVAQGEVDGIEPLGGARIVALSRDGERVRVRIERQGEEEERTVDRIVSNVGYRPDLTLTRELQVHLCWASEGPMKLAASLLAQAGNADCLAQESAGVDTLRNPEPDFFVIGSKSYGRSSNFLLRVGFEQIEAIADTLTP